MSNSQVDHNLKLPVKETLPDPKCGLLHNEDDQGRLLHHEIQVNHSIRFPDALASCLTRCLNATCKAFWCCCRHCSDHDVPLSEEETEPEPGILNKDDEE